MLEINFCSLRFPRNTSLLLGLAGQMVLLDFRGILLQLEAIGIAYVIRSASCTYHAEYGL